MPTSLAPLDWSAFSLSRCPKIRSRRTGILLRIAAGYDTDQIANDIGMSRPMVDH
jgi:hypothetical protein